MGTADKVYRGRRAGFTLIEIMLVAAIIGLLAAIAIPKFGELITRARESAILGHLGALRSAVSIYYADNEGEYPYDPYSLRPKYIEEFPRPSMPAVSSQGNPGHASPGDWEGRWDGYILWSDGPGDPPPDDYFHWRYIGPWFVLSAYHGKFNVKCDHKSSRGISWSAY